MIGKDDTPIISYEVLSKANIELRVYKELLLVSAPMNNKDNSGKNQSFMKLFRYISGENISAEKIEMTAPVFMDGKAENGTKIPMTAPVFMDEKGSDEALMSFVLPDRYTMLNAPKPKNPELKLHQLKDYKVAVIRFSGLLSKSNIKKHKQILENWIAEKGYEEAGRPKAAGYNPPFTLPPFRRNEVLIPVSAE